MIEYDKSELEKYLKKSPDEKLYKLHGIPEQRMTSVPYSLEKEMQSKCFWLGFIFGIVFTKSALNRLLQKWIGFQFLCMFFIWNAWVFLMSLFGIDRTAEFSHILWTFDSWILFPFRRSISIAKAIKLCAWKKKSVLYGQVLLQSRRTEEKNHAHS